MCAYPTRRNLISRQHRQSPGLTLQNVKLFEQWHGPAAMGYTFDSIGDPIFVHDPELDLAHQPGLGNLLGRDSAALIGRTVTDLLPHKGIKYQRCPY